MEKTLPDYIVDELVARIYVRQYKPGFRLPAERDLQKSSMWIAPHCEWHCEHLTV